MQPIFTAIAGRRTKFELLEPHLIVTMISKLQSLSQGLNSPFRFYHIFESLKPSYAKFPIFSTESWGRKVSRAYSTNLDLNWGFRGGTLTPTLLVGYYTFPLDRRLLGCPEESQAKGRTHFGVWEYGFKLCIWGKRTGSDVSGVTGHPPPDFHPRRFYRAGVKTHQGKTSLTLQFSFEKRFY